MEKFDQRDVICELNFGYRYNAKTVVCIYELEFGYTEVTEVIRHALLKKRIVIWLPLYHKYLANLKVD